MIICLIISVPFLAVHLSGSVVVDNQRKQNHTLIQICSCFANRNATALRHKKPPYLLFTLMLLIHLPKLCAYCQILLFVSSFRTQKIIQSHSSFPPTIDPVIMRKWINFWGRQIMEHSLASVARLCCKWPTEQRHILPGHTSFSVQILKPLVIVLISIPDGSFFHRLEQMRGQGAKFALEIPWKLKVKPWVVLSDATRLGSFSPFFQANQRNLIGDSHLPSCSEKAKGDGELLHVKKVDLRPVPWWSDPSLTQVNCSSLTSMGGECCHSLLPFLVIHHPTLWQKSCCSEICCVKERTAIWNEPDSCLILPVSSLFRKS